MNSLGEALQQYGLLLGIIAALAIVFGVGFLIYRAARRKEIAVLKNRIAHLRQQLTDLAGEDQELRELVDQMRQQLEQAADDETQLKTEYAAFQEQAQATELALRAECDRAQEQLEQAADDDKQLRTEYAAFQKRAQATELALRAECDKAQETNQELTAALQRLREHSESKLKDLGKPINKDLRNTIREKISVMYNLLDVLQQTGRGGCVGRLMSVDEQDR